MAYVKTNILLCKTMDGHRIEFGFAAKLPADNFFVKLSIKTANIKFKKLTSLKHTC